MTVSGDEKPRIRISPEASAAIDAWAWGLADGSIELHQLPDAICTFFNVAYELGRASREDEIRLYKSDADRLWLRLFAPRERQDYLLNRLDQAAALADRPDVDAVLDEAWRIYVASLDNIREPIALTATKHFKEVA